MGKHSIQPVLEHYGATNLRETWGWQKMKCVVHEDSTASASVNVTENAFACHACGVKGDTYKIIMEKEGVGYREAIAIAEGITGESRGNIQGKHSSSRRVPSQEGIISRRRGYSPPRSSRRTPT